MDFVSPPFLLDFAGVVFDPPDFEADQMADWHARLTWLFGRNVSLVHDVYYALSRHGIYYTDFTPNNLKMKDHPDYDPTPDDAGDEGL